MKYTGFPLRYQFSVVELKRDRAKPEDVTQVINYSKWVAGRLANSEIETVRPILIAFGFDEETITKARDSDFSDRGISLFQYEVKNSDLRFEKVSG
jgi:RecB family endonuclease NucS